MKENWIHFKTLFYVPPLKEWLFVYFFRACGNLPK